MTEAEIAACEAPFPDARYKAGACQFPTPSYVMDVWLAAVERQRTKLESATFPIQTFSAFAKTDPHRDGTASTKCLLKAYPQGPTQTLTYRRTCQKVRGSNPFGRTSRP